MLKTDYDKKERMKMIVQLFDQGLISKKERDIWIFSIMNLDEDDMTMDNW